MCQAEVVNDNGANRWALLKDRVLALKEVGELTIALFFQSQLRRLHL